MTQANHETTNDAMTMAQHALQPVATPPTINFVFNDNSNRTYYGGVCNDNSTSELGMVPTILEKVSRIEKHLKVSKENVELP